MAGGSTTTRQADRNFAAILDYATHMRVHLDGSNIFDLDDPRIFENPVIYMSEPGGWTTDEAEATSLRAYLLKGGLHHLRRLRWRRGMAQPRHGR